MNSLEKRFKAEIEKFGSRVRELRKERSLTQVELEVLCKINNGDLSRIENGLANIEFFTIVKLADGLDVGISDLFTSA